MSKLGEYIANTKLDGDNTKAQIEDHHDKYIPRRFSSIESLQLNETITVEERSIAGDALIWGHSTFGIWGTYKWAASAAVSFILGNPLAGVLGTNKLGSQASAWTTVEVLTFSDSVQTTGREILADRLIGDVSTNPAVEYLAIGTGTTAWTLADTALETETGIRSATVNTWDGTSLEIEFQGVIYSTHPTGTITEVGFLNNVTGTKLFSRKNITPYVFDGSTELRITNEVEIIIR